MRISNFTNCLVLIVISSLMACSQTTPTQTAKINLVSPEVFNQTLQSLKSPKILLDVRTPAEYKKGHLENAILIDIFRDDFLEAIRQLDTTQAVFVYCGIGGRSEEAAEILQKNGFKTIYDLDGGISAWRKQNLPVTMVSQ
jgi:rhodanese-related sulfurtransferase